MERKKLGKQQKKYQKSKKMSLKKSWKRRKKMREKMWKKCSFCKHFEKYAKKPEKKAGKKSEMHPHPLINMKTWGSAIRQAQSQPLRPWQRISEQLIQCTGDGLPVVGDIPHTPLGKLSGSQTYFVFGNCSAAIKHVKRKYTGQGENDSYRERMTHTGRFDVIHPLPPITPPKNENGGASKWQPQKLPTLLVKLQIGSP